MTIQQDANAVMASLKAAQRVRQTDEVNGLTKVDGNISGVVGEETRRGATVTTASGGTIEVDRVGNGALLQGESYQVGTTSGGQAQITVPGVTPATLPSTPAREPRVIHSTVAPTPGVSIGLPRDIWVQNLGYEKNGAPQVVVYQWSNRDGLWVPITPSTRVMNVSIKFPTVGDEILMAFAPDDYRLLSFNGLGATTFTLNTGGAALAVNDPIPRGQTLRINISATDGNAFAATLEFLVGL